jgi:tetratricopeptide (TPR) repeat protein
MTRMKPESLVFGVAGAFFGLIAGWLIGSQQATARAPMPAAQQQAAAPASGAPAGATAPKVVLDEAEVRRLKDIAGKDPANATPRTQLGNLYFDAEHYPEAVEWYTKALELDPTNPDVSTDLGVSYYYQNDPDRALAQFKRSLEIDPKHTKTMLNEGIVLAFGKQDLQGAANAWQRVIDIAPNTPEGQAARRALDSLKGAHPNMNAGTAAAPGTN